MLFVVLSFNCDHGACVALNRPMREYGANASANRNDG